jgi:cytidylate kinase
MSNEIIHRLVNERASLMVSERAMRREIDKIQKRLDQLDALLEGVDLGRVSVDHPTAAAVPSTPSTE